MSLAAEAQSTTTSSIDPIAQTIFQLYGQLERRGHGPEDLRLVSRAYQLASSLLACQVRGSGRSLLEHHLGTASIVASLGADATLVAATVAHAVYAHGDFGRLGRRVRESERKRVLGSLGQPVEEIIARYSTLYLSPETIPELRQRLSRGDPLDHKAITIRLGDQLDLYGTREALYCSNVESRRVFAREFGEDIAGIAEYMGYPQLAVALRAAYADVLARTLPPGLEFPRREDGVILPASYRMRAMTALYRRVRGEVWRWTGR